MTGTRVALIGAGASGFQFAPAVAEQVEQLSVFQRTAQWMFPNAMYHDSVGDGVRWAMNHRPFYGRWYQFLVMWPGADKGLDAARVDPSYPNQDYAVSELNAAARLMFTDWITNQVSDEHLLVKVLPDYPATGKRTLQDNGSWLRTLHRDNVELVRTPIQRITTSGVVTADGVARDADITVYATGFRHTDVLWPLKIIGATESTCAAFGVDARMPTSGSLFRDSQLLSHLWARRPSRARWQLDIQLRTSNALHQQLPRESGRGQRSLRRADCRSRPPRGTSAPKMKSRRWCGRIRRSSTPTSRTLMERSIRSARGDSTSTGPRYANPIGRSS
jgi:cation diffusion facilitator CzcD-associated flavoprotein CzcO